MKRITGHRKLQSAQESNLINLMAEVRSRFLCQAAFLFSSAESPDCENNSKMNNLLGEIFGEEV